MSERRFVHLHRVSWTLVDQAVVSLGNFLINVQLARMLPMADYGIYALLFSVIYLFQHFCVAILIYPMSLKVAHADRGDASIIMSATFAALAAVQVLFSLAIAGCFLALGRPGLALAAALFSFVWQMQDAMRRGLMAQFRHREAIAGDGLAYMGAAALFFVVLHTRAIALEQGLALMTVLSLVACVIQAAQLRVVWPSLAGMRQCVQEFWSAGRWAAVSGVFMHARLQLFPWTLGLIYGPAATAGYQAVMNLANAVNPVVFGLTNLVSQGTAEAQAQPVEARSWVAVKTYILAGLPVIVGYAVVLAIAPEFLLKVLYGGSSPYLENGTAVRLISLVILVNYAAECFSALLYGSDQARLASWISLFGLAAAIAVVPIVGVWGVIGAVFGLLVTNIARLLASWIWGRAAVRNLLAPAQKARP